MPLVFRSVNKSRWNRQKHQDEYQWLTAGEIPAEPLVDVVRRDIQSNELSVYVVENDESSIMRMVAAFAGTRQRPDKLDYKVVDYDQMVNLNFEFKQSSGNTPDEEVNFWHRDLHHLTVSQLTNYIKLMYLDTDTVRVSKKNVEKWLVASIQNNFIEGIARLPEQTMQDKVKELLKKYG